LEPYKFDIAIDLSHVNMSQPLMFLSGAPFLFGFNPRENTWLSAGLDSVVTHDFVNGLECVAHATKVMGLVEWLALLMKSHAKVERRSDLSRAALEPFAIGAHDQFALFHTGARIGFSRWPYYDRLASRVLTETALKVVLVTEDPTVGERLPRELLENERFRLVDSRPTFDQLDALVSFCTVLVGNDSGPKHLGALRGVKVVSIHSSRINWNEWGQEGEGLIISRGVPCAGCRLHHDPEECGQGHVCINNITVDEVFGAMMKLVSGPGESASSTDLIEA
jgi:ADP-heptose:LPS heptosyltransferase